MKKLGIILVLLAVVLLVAPFGIGKVAEKRLNADLDKFMEQVPFLKVSERTWSGGWFRSSQTITFELSDTFGKMVEHQVAAADAANEGADAAAAADAEGAASPESADTATDATTEESAAPDPADVVAAAAGLDSLVPTKLTVRNDVLHGPILGAAGIGLARVDSHIELSEKVREKIKAVFGPEPAFEVSTRVGFFGGGTTTFKSAGRKLALEGKDVDFTYDTFKVSVGFSRNADSYDIDGRLPKLEVKDASDGTHFTLTSMTLDGDGKRVMGDLYDGEFALRVEELDVKGKGGSGDMLVEDAHYIVKQNTKDNFVDIAAEMGTGAIASEQFKSMNLEVDAIHYDFSVRHLHAPTLQKITSGIKAVYTMSLTNPDAIKTAVIEPMMDNASELLKHDPQFGIDRLGLVTPEGEIIAKGLIKFVGVTVDDFKNASGMALINKIEADFSIEAAQKVLEKFPNGATMAGGAVDSGYAKREGDKLVCHITYKAGELLVNGKPVPIPGLGGQQPGAMEGGDMGPDMENMPEE